LAIAVLFQPQRRLDGTGASFPGLLTGVRCDLVGRYLHNPGYSLQRVGQLPGYATSSAFSHGFNSRYGMAPARWRASRHGTSAHTRRVARR
jgi:AraC-like DNA-binding protein